MAELKPCPFCGGEAEWDEKNKALSAHSVKRQFHLLAVFFENILIRVGTVNIWLGFGTGGLTMDEYINCGVCAWV